MTESRLAERRTPMPLLLDDFPIPPSHIPNTPLATPISMGIPSPGLCSNPPLSRPPSTPLPPVPGPSPISEHETLMFISAERSRRLSKMSTASTVSQYSKRDSTATVSSLASSSAHPSIAHQPSSPTSPRFGSAASIRSFRSASSHASSSQSHSRRVLEKSPMLEPKIFEEDPAEISQISLSDLPSLSSSTSTLPRSHRGLSDTEEDESSELGIGLSLSRRRSGRSHRMGPGMNDSISSIDMRDLPALQEDEAELIVVPPIAAVVSKSAPHLRPGYILAKPPRPPTAIMNKELPPLPLNMHGRSSTLTRSDTASTSTSASHSRSGSSHLRTLSSHLQDDDARNGAESPDIVQIMSRTPRPSRKSSSHFSGSRSRSRPNSTRRSCGSSLHSHRSKRFDDGNPVPVPVVRRDDSEIAYARKQRDDDDESDYGEVLDGTGTVMDARMLDRDIEERLERQLDGLGSEDELSDGGLSDSSIDMQTPLPHLMLREGVLSPHSKLLGKCLRAPSPQDRHLSMGSITGSVMTKTGIFKDERDTVRRRVRHRDGRLLRGGLGLTTGLGWSDSEDEDAPSPLTRRVSSMVLSRRASANSLHSHTSQLCRSPHPLPRSVSETQASDTIARHRANMRVREVKPSQPPTAWSSSRASGISTLSLAPSVRSHASDSSSGRSVSSYGGRRSERTPSLDHIRELDAESFRDETGMATPSSVSSSSVAMPLTPVGDEDAGSWSYSTGPALSATPSVARRIPSRFNLKTPSSKTASASESLPFPRERTQSASSNGSANASVGHIPPPSAPRQASIPRPLRLPQATGLRPTGSQSNMRQPSTRTPSATSTLSTPQPDRGRSVSTAAAKTSLPSYSASPLRLARPPALSDPPSPSPVSPSDRKPRIGAGMVYRTGSASSRPSMMRAPNPATLRPVAAKV